MDKIKPRSGCPGAATLARLLIALTCVISCGRARYAAPELTRGPAITIADDGVSLTTKPTPASPSLIRSEVVLADRDSEEGKEESENREAQNPGGLARERFLRRLNAEGIIPPNALLAAKHHADTMPILPVAVDSETRDAGIWAWEWLGPGNIGGRVRTIAIDPTNANRIFVGSVSGGIWRTTNGGSSWSPINDFLASLAVTTLVIDPSNANILYAGTGEGFGAQIAITDELPGAGVFKSTDGGNTWTQLADTVPTGNPLNDAWGFVNRLAVHPTNGQILLAATNSGIWRSINGGADWTQRTFTVSVFDIDFDPSDGNKAVAGRADGTALFSIDAGDTWNVATGLTAGAGRVEVAYAPNNTARVYASVDLNSGSLFRSTDGGASYSLRNDTTNYFASGAGGSQGWYDNALWVAPDNSNTVVVGGIDLWRSTDGGTTLARISDWSRYHSPGDSAHADQHFILHHPGYGASNRQVFVANDGGIQMTSNILTAGTQSWTNLANDLGITQFYGGAAATDRSVILGGTQDNDTLRLADGDGTGGWFQAKTGDGGYCAINPNDANVRYSEYVWLFIFKNVWGTDVWLPANNGLSDTGSAFSALFIAPFVIDPNTPDRLLAGGASIWRTTDGAGGWSSIRGPRSPVPTPLCSAIDFAASNTSRAWVGYTDGQVSRTLDLNNASPTWTNVGGSGEPFDGRFITDIAINPTNSSEVIVTVGGYSSDTIWLTPDNGATWLPRNGSGATALPPVQVNTVRYHPANDDWVYVGTDLGVYASEDKGLTWNQTPRFGDHEGPVNTEVSELFWEGSQYLIAATHGRGMYRVRPMVTVFVDAAYTGPEGGSQAAPYDTVTEGLNASGHGTTLSIRAGTYDEAAALLFNKRGAVVVTGGSVLIR